VRTQLTLLPNYRLGNILLYLIGNHLYYFIPVYINTQVENAVITKMAFIAVVDATTGARVAVGADSSQAYYAISGGTPVILGSAERVQKLNSLFTDKGYSLINPSQISANVEIRIANITYTDETQGTSVNATVNNFIANYCQKYGATEIYYWTAPNGDINFGILVSASGIVKLYYVTVQIR
jgi:hypothetical protein